MEKNSENFSQGGDKSQPPEPASISYGKAVQFQAEGLAREEGLNVPEKHHYAQADKELEAAPEEEIELGALTQKLKELVGLENTGGFFNALDIPIAKANEIIEQTTSEQELRQRLRTALAPLKGSHPDRESLINALRYSSEQYEREIVARFQEAFNTMKSKMEFDEDFPQREQAQGAVNEIIDYTNASMVRQAVEIYIARFGRLVTDEINKRLGH